MEVTVKTGVSKEPLSLDEVQNYIKYDESMGDEVSLIKSMIISARQLTEKYLNKALAKQTLVCYFDKWDMDNRIIEIPYSPHSRIVTLKSIDYEQNKTELTVNKDYYRRGNYVYELEIFQQIGTGVIGLEDQKIYEYSYECEYVTGHGITIEDGEEGSSTEKMPEPIKLAMLKQISQWYDNRENFQSVLSMEVMQMLSPYSKNPYN